MQRYFIAISLLSSVLFFACHRTPINKSQATAATITTNSSSPTAIASSSDKNADTKKIIVDNNLDIQKLGGVATKIDSLGINGDVLSIFVNYGGGCKEHVFELYSDGTVAKSLPPIATLYLKHINNGDACRKLVMRELKFDISEIKMRGTLTIKVTDQTIEYKAK